MIWNIKSLVDRLKEGVKEAVESAIEERLTNTKDMQRNFTERERVVSERETTWKDQLYRREAEIERQELQLRLEREAFEKEKGLLNGNASIQNNQDGALEITVDGERYRCLRYSKAKK